SSRPPGHFVRNCVDDCVRSGLRGFVDLQQAISRRVRHDPTGAPAPRNSSRSDAIWWKAEVKPASPNPQMTCRSALPLRDAAQGPLLQDEDFFRSLLFFAFFPTAIVLALAFLGSAAFVVLRAFGRFFSAAR